MANGANEANDDDVGGDDVGHDVLDRGSTSSCGDGGSNTLDIPSEAADQSDPSSHLI